uniref:Uncharacterized protein n=1 Tax=Rhizophora mucronata TaxID=61149 RepID=A0A2P2J238_RHIMU
MLVIASFKITRNRHPLIISKSISRPQFYNESQWFLTLQQSPKPH